MNSIHAKMTITEYVNGEHLMIFVDNIRFDKWLCNKNDNNDYMNLIPAWLGWLFDPKEQEYVWAKTRLSESETTVVPILVCPDDLDFSCTVVVCEVRYTDETVRWTKIGIDMTGFPSYIGKNIEWFKKVPSLEFPRKQYETCLNKFIRA